MENLPCNPKDFVFSVPAQRLQMRDCVMYMPRKVKMQCNQENIMQSLKDVYKANIAMAPPANKPTTDPARTLDAALTVCITMPLEVVVGM